MAIRPNINFYFLSSNPSFKDRNKLKLFISFIFKRERKKLGFLNFIFTTDRKVLQMNKQFLDHDYLTDILTFDLSEAKGAIIAEIYISVERVKENAFFHDESFKNEFHRVIFHGVLHLCGYNDKNQSEKSKMRRKENEYLGLYFK